MLYFMTYQRLCLWPTNFETMRTNWKNLFIYESNEININESKKTEPHEQVEEGLKKINKLSSLKC